MSIRSGLMLLIVRDCKYRMGELARHGFIPSSLWDALANEMKAEGLYLPAPIISPGAFPAIILGSVPLYADDCDDRIRLVSRGGEPRRYAWASLYDLLAPSNVGRADSTALARPPQGAA